MSQENDPEKKNKMGVNITVSEEDTSKIVKVLIDICSPASETLGLLGDKIKVYREKQTIKTLKQAKEIADAEGKQIELPPPKFLIPYLNGASLENEDDTSLQEKWATLLVNAGSQPDSVSYFARGLLENISSEEVKFLDDLVTRQKARNIEEETYHIRQNQLTKEFEAAFEAMSNLLDAGEIKSFEEFSNSINDINASVPELIVTKFNFQTKSDVVSAVDGYASYSSGGFDELRHLFLMLERWNVVQMRDRMLLNMKTEKRLLGIDTLEFTGLGLAVVKKIYPRSEE